MIRRMNNKPLKKVCTKCLDANKQLQLNADFFVDVQYGVCDCCGDRGVVIPFERFFNGNTKLTPYNIVNKTSNQEERQEASVNYSKDISDLHEKINPIQEKLGEIDKELEELRKGKVEGTEVESIKQSINSLREYVQDIGEKVVNHEPIPSKNQSQKQPKNNKVGEDAAYE